MYGLFHELSRIDDAQENKNMLCIHLFLPQTNLFLSYVRRLSRLRRKKLKRNEGAYSMKLNRSAS